MRQRFIQSFSTSGTEHEAIDAELLGKPYVAYIEDGRYIDWNTLSPTPPIPPEPVYSAMPLTFEIKSNGKIYWECTNGLAKTIEYKLNDGEWTSVTSSLPGTPITVKYGDTIQFRGDNSTYATANTSYNYFSVVSSRFEIKGNIMSLVHSTGFETATTLTASYAFNRLFKDCTGLTSCENLVLPATKLTERCYDNLFWGCTKLTKAPVLPATNLARGCYLGMFQDCTSLTTAPVLPATVLTTECYEFMFIGDTKLNYINCLATVNINSSNSTYNWVNNVSATGTFVKHPNASWPSDTINGIPKGWTVEDADI